VFINDDSQKSSDQLILQIGTITCFKYLSMITFCDYTESYKIEIKLYPSKELN